MTQLNFINQVKDGAIAGWHKYKILPSISVAQACLESGWGTSGLAKAPNYNLFGIKADDAWTGKKVLMDTQEWSLSKGYYWTKAYFRAYNSWNESIEDHGAFFTSTEWRKQNYAKVVGEKNYRVVAQELRNAGYATDIEYPNKLIRIIDQYNLTQYDKIAFEGGLTTTPNTNNGMSNEYYLRKTVGDSLSSGAEAAAKHIDVTFIGDSLLVGTEPKLKRFAFKQSNYNAKGSRQWTHSDAAYSAIAQLKTMLANNQVHSYVVFILGTNRGVTANEIKQAVDLCGVGRKILLVDTLSEVAHRESVAQAYKQASEQYSNVFYGNWSQYATHKIREYYYADGANGEHIHMTPIGYERHANFIMHALYQMYNYGNTSGTPKGTVSISDINYDDGIFTSPIGETVIYNKKLNDQFAFKPKNGKVLWIEKVLSSNSDDPQEMIKEGIAYMKEHAHPSVQYTVKLKELPDTVSIGDIGIFIDHEFNPPLAIEARILNITTSETHENNNTVTIGNVTELFPQSKEDIIALQKQLQQTREELLEDYHKGEPLEIKIEATNGLMLSGSSSGFETELIQGSTTDLIFNSTSNIINLYKPNDIENSFYIKGKLAENHIINHKSGMLVDEKPISGNYDINSNPQGADIANPLDAFDSHELEVSEFTVNFLNDLGQFVGTVNVPVYHDGEFSTPILFDDKSFVKAVIATDIEINFDKFSIVEKASKRNTKESTQLIARVYQGNRDVTERFDNFLWSRVSNDYRLDEGWNDKNKFVQANHITVYPDDIQNGKSTFNVKVFDDDFNELIASGAALVQTTAEGKSAYQLAVEAGFEGSLDEWIESLKGKDGTSGTPGPKGADGRTTYIHTAWALDDKGTGFSTSVSANKLYMGTYTDFTKEDSTDYLKYKWVKIKGEDGSDGYTPIKGTDYFDGRDGQDGKSSYTYIRYSNNADGSSMTDSPVGAKYIGIAVVSNNTVPKSPSSYNWTLIKGSDGVAGEKGADGRTSYMHIKYSNDGGKTFTANNGEDLGSWIGIYTDFTKADSPSVSSYTWNKIKGVQGPQGPEGKQGIQGTKGADGKSSYTHIAYATGDQGQSFSHSTFPQATHIGIYVSDNQNSSDNWRDYKWTLIKGANGAKGLPGAKGADGKTPYFHTAYANEGQNLVSPNDVQAWGATGNTLTKVGNVYTLKATANLSGLYVTSSRFTVNNIYTLKFNIQVTSGSLATFGGHSTVYQQLDYRIDGKSISGIYYENGYTGHPFNDKQVHEVIYKFKYIGGTGDTSLYIQPNRASSSKTESHTVVISNLKIAENDGITDFSIIDSTNRKLIGTYTDYTESDSTNPLDYKWVDMVGGVEVGGRNYFNNYNGEENSVSNNTSSERYIFPSNDNSIRYIELEPNTTYTMSAWFRTDVQTSRTLDMYFVHSPVSGTVQHRLTQYQLTTEYRKYTFTFTTSDNPSQRGYGRFDLNGNSETNTVTMFMKLAKLEKGNIATDWTPAPEDVQANIDNIQVGGRNLALGTDVHTSGNSYNTNKTYKYSDRFSVERAKIEKYLTISCDVEIINAKAPLQGQGQNRVGIELSYYAGSTAKWVNAFYYPKVGETYSGRLTKTFDISDITSHRNTNIAAFLQSQAENMKVSNIKVEFGNKPTDWTPAPEDVETAYKAISKAERELAEINAKAYADGKITAEEQRAIQDAKNKLAEAKKYVDDLEIGGRNLLLNSGKEVKNNDYMIKHYTPSTPLVEGEKYTVTICTTPARGVSLIIPYLSGGYAAQVNLPLNGTSKQVVTGTFTAGYYKDRRPTDDIFNANLMFYRFPNNGTVTENTTIHWVKVEKGNKATDWTPAPEDVQAGIDSKADSESTEQALNEATALLQTLQQEVRAAALDGELKDFIAKYNEEQKALDEDKKESNKKLQEALNSVSLLTNNMDNMSETWNFVDRYIKNTPQGIVVGNHEEGSYILIKEDRLSFFSNNEEVAFIAQNLMEISRGAFVEQIQISQYIFEKYGTNQLAIRYAG